jgi:hypothetical protein
MIFQSTGILSQGLTKIISQDIIFSISVSINKEFIFTKAVFGARCISFEIASFVLDLALFSRYFQKLTKVINKAETSKYIHSIFIPFNQIILQLSMQKFI